MHNDDEVRLLDDESLESVTGGGEWVIIQSMSSPIFRSIPESTSNDVDDPLKPATIAAPDTGTATMSTRK